VTLALLAHAFLVVTRGKATSDPATTGTPQLDHRLGLVR
jgi:hypothetical protein